MDAPPRKDFTVHRIATLLCLLLTLGGCTEYKWGHDWKPDRLGGWQDHTDPKLRYGASLGATCNASPLWLKVVNHGQSTYQSLLFIPLFPDRTGGEYPLWITVNHPALKACSSSAPSPLRVKMGDQVVQGLRFPERAQEDGTCVIEFDDDRYAADEMSIEIDPAVLPCTIAPVTLKKDRYFCIRNMRWGGSPSCRE
ncbi:MULTISPECIES: hypothetical protein [Pseudomonas]|jgi:hypothetical protein|uniref:Lipoprotein n=1 Tax=Pseudomonas qingdaonensis TaxID=2056231 RepID=A0ABX8DU66_9PSED|nr:MULTISPECIES: hypothetical protein [Pseudomonas]MEC6741926.1 hypothetical protein [Pseudomonas qingdaonensis]QVL19843.1 hypothetical protein KH389_04460 [Pseudomonas qingdaonensis]